MCEKVSTLEELKEKFLLVKQSQHTGELAMRDDRNCLADFLKALDRKNYTYTGMRDYALDEPLKAAHSTLALREV